MAFATETDLRYPIGKFERVEASPTTSAALSLRRSKKPRRKCVLPSPD